jgi:hypothetical protein
VARGGALAASSAGASAAASEAPRPAPRSQGEIEVADRLQDEPHESPPQHDAEQQPESAADEAEHGGFAEHQRQDLAAPHAEGAQTAEELAALDDREGHRVVDQEGAAEQGEERQGAQIEAKRPRHLLERLGAGGGAGEMDAWRQERGEVPARGFAGLAVGQGEIDPRQAPGQVEDLLRGGDIHQREVRQRLATGVVGRTDHADEEELSAAGADLHRETVADGEPESSRGRTLEQHRAGLGEEADEIAAAFEAPPAPAPRKLRNGASLQGRGRGAQDARRRSTAPPPSSAAGRRSPRPRRAARTPGCRVPADAGEERLVEAVRVAGDLVGGLAGGGVGGDGRRRAARSRWRGRSPRRRRRRSATPARARANWADGAGGSAGWRGREDSPV